MNNFAKFAYSCRALASTALTVTVVAVYMKELGALDYIKEQKENLKNNIKARKMVH